MTERWLGMKKEAGRKELFESMPVGSALMTMAIPTIISQLINLVYNMVDTIYIGRTGDAYKTAAVTLAFTIFMMTIALSNLFGIGGGSLMARLSGSGKADRAKSVCAFSFYGAIGIAIFYSLLVGFFLNPLLILLGASENTLAFARQYLIVVVVIGNVPVILSAVAAHLLRNSGYSRQASVGLSGGGILNILLDPVFMFVILPKGQEVLGAALATLIANTAACIYLVLTLRRLSRESALSCSLQDMRRIRREEVRELFSVGVPSAFLTGLFDLANIVLNSLMSGHGDLELAAIGIVMKAERLPNAINVGICQGMLPIVAYNYSSGNHRRMQDVIRTARIFGLCVSGVTLLMFEACSPWICRIFLSTKTGNAEAALTTIGLAVVFLRVRCLASPLQFLNYNSSFYMQAVGYGSGTLMHACFRELVFYIPFMYLFNSLAGTDGLVRALIAGEGCGAAFALFLIARWNRKNLRPEWKRPQGAS